MIYEWRLEYWQGGRKRVRWFGSKKQCRRCVEREHHIENVAMYRVRRVVSPTNSIDRGVN